jgi:DNA repair exonuclease SbcCD ATPase subunit
MSTLNTNFTQFIDLTINLSQGAINTTFLNALLHIIVDQLQLSSNLIELSIGSASSSLANQISLLDNRENRYRVEVRQLEIKQEIDGGRDAVPMAMKVFAITNNDTDVDGQQKASSTIPSGYPLNPIQSISIEQFKTLETKVNGIHELIADALPSDRSIIKEEQQQDGGERNSMKTLIDLLNATKRIDALEIVVRQTASVLRSIECDSIRLNEMQKEIEEKIRNFEVFEAEVEESIKKHERSLDDKENHIENVEVQIKALQAKLSDCNELIENFQCKCDNPEFEERLFTQFHERIAGEFDSQFQTLKDEIEGLRGECQIGEMKLTDTLTALEASTCEQFKNHDRDLVKFMSEVREKLNAKLNKKDFQELKKTLVEELTSLEGKIESVDCKRAVAAGVTKKILKNVQCVSCGEKVIQIDDPLPQQMLVKSEKQLQQEQQLSKNEFLQGIKLSTRLCGGKHTITKPSERVFRSV